ncbi:calcium-activated chloride channel-domain-containing protein [Powellomyces hirtus]|nr:calcium-activated chloride channel-domain-containing protein [Powellomyces hirtus]
MPAASGLPEPDVHGATTLRRRPTLHRGPLQAGERLSTPDDELDWNFEVLAREYARTARRERVETGDGKVDEEKGVRNHLDLDTRAFMSERTRLPASPPVSSSPPYHNIPWPTATSSSSTSTTASSEPPHIHPSPHALQVLLEVAGPGYDDVVTRTIENERVVLLMYVEDVELFDEIVEWKRENRGAVEDALRCFADRPHADALTRIIFKPKSTEWDAILKYTVDSEHPHRSTRAYHPYHSRHHRKSTPPHPHPHPHSIKASTRESYEAITRGLYTRQMLLANLFIEIEVDPESDDHEERYVKIMAPFDALCKEAEKLKLRMALKPAGKPCKPPAPASPHLEIPVAPPLDCPTTPPLPPPVSSTEPWSTTETVSKLLAYMFTTQPCPPSHNTTPFRRSRLTNFLNGDPAATSIPHVFWNFFNPARRSELVYSTMLHHTLDPSSISTTVARSKAYHVRSQTTIRDLLEADVYTDWYPVHDCDAMKAGFGKGKKGAGKAKCLREQLWRMWCGANWKTLWKGFITGENVDVVREYVGEQIAFYFDWMAFYTIWAVPAALFGLIAFTYGLIKALRMDVSTDSAAAAAPTSMSPSMMRLAVVFDNGATIAFALGMSFWATLFLEFWKRRQKYLAYIWDVAEYRREEQIRPQWVSVSTIHGTSKTAKPAATTTTTGTSPVWDVHPPERHDPYPYRFFRRALSLGVVGLCLTVLVAIIAGIVAYKAWAKQERFANGVTRWAVSGGVGGVVEIVQVLVVQRLYYTIAWKINCYDNYKYDSQFEDGFIFKTFLFNFINNYAVFVYIGVVKGMLGTHYVLGRWPEKCNPVNIGGFGGEEGDDEQPTTTPVGHDDDGRNVSCMQELSLQMAIIFVGLQFVRSAQKAVWPWFVHRIRILLKRLQRTYDGHNHTDNHTHASYPPKTTKAKIKNKQSSHRTTHHTTLSTITIAPPTPAALSSSSSPPALPARAPIPQYARDEVLFNYDDEVLCQDYGMTVIQFGYIALFSCAFPLAPCFAILNNVVDIRVDSYKMLFEYRRPWAQRAQSIGLWTSIMKTISSLGAPLNALVIAFSSSTFHAFIVQHFPPNHHALAAKLAFVLIFEHAVLACKQVVTYMVPPTPATVKRALDREVREGRREMKAHDESGERW